jgi:threonine synthase
MLALYGGDVERLRRDVAGRAFTDDMTIACIARTERRWGYVLDPHSAVGLLGLEPELASDTAATGIVLATAHPAKFPGVVERAIGRRVAAPARLARVLQSCGEARALPPTSNALYAMLERA